MWASGARLEGTCGSTIKSADWKESSDGSGGWLATGCSAGTVGVSWISYPSARPAGGREGEEGGNEGAPEEVYATPSEGEGSLYKSHFLLRGHLGEVTIVRWMPAGVRLASYDSWGHITMWNNRAHVLAYEFQIKPAVVISDIQWSPCGSYLVACARSGHILLLSSDTGMSLDTISVESTACHLKRANFTCCSWNQPGTRIAFGTCNGEVVFLDPTTRRITTRTVNFGVPVQYIEWYGPEVQCRRQNGSSYPSQGLSVYLKNGDFVLYPRTDSRECSYCKTKIVNGLLAWSSDKSALVVIGSSRRFLPVARFLNHKGQETFKVSEDLPKFMFPVRNVLWALQDSVVIFTCGPHIYTLKVDHSLPTLESLCRHTIMSKIIGEGEDTSVELLPLPKRVVSELSRSNEPVIPNLFDVGRADILSTLYEPVPHNHRLHCVLEPSNSSAMGTYTLKLEHLNSYVPLLQARRKPNKLTSIQIGYNIEPAFDSSHCRADQDGERWASGLSSWSLRDEPRSRAARTRPSFLRRLWSVFSPAHSQGVMDSTQAIGATATAVSNAQEKLILAEVERSSLMNQFRFRTNSQNGSLGSVNICTNYIKCRPRNIAVVLPRACSVSEEENDLVIYSKEPEWNDNFRIYELDFGGRVGRDSIKNFQIEHNGQVVLQFGKVDSTNFCLDFQAPFSVVQAMCVALSCIL